MENYSRDKNVKSKSSYFVFHKDNSNPMGGRGGVKIEDQPLQMQGVANGIFIYQYYLIIFIRTFSQI